MVLCYFLPFHFPSNLEPLDARGVAASIKGCLNKNQSLHFFQYKPYSFGPKLIKNNTIHAQAMTMRK